MNISLYPVVITEREIKIFKTCLYVPHFLFIHSINLVLNFTSSLVNGSNKIYLFKKLYNVPGQFT